METRPGAPRAARETKSDGVSEQSEREAEPASTRRGALARRELLMAGSLGAVVLVLGISGLGLIPVPNSTGNATLLHLPVVVGGVLGGPYVGLILGGVFGTFSWVDHAAPIFRDPLVAVVPRLFIGLVAWWVFFRLASRGRYLAAAAAGALGSAANTAGVLSAALLLGYIPAYVVLAVLPQALLEAALAAIAVAVALRLWSAVSGSRAGGREEE